MKSRMTTLPLRELNWTVPFSSAITLSMPVLFSDWASKSYTSLTSPETPYIEEVIPKRDSEEYPMMQNRTTATPKALHVSPSLRILKSSL